jgi:hypothetical protein
MAVTTDDFNRANFTDLGSDWDSLDSGWTILSNVAHTDAAFYNIVTWDAGVRNFTDDHYSQIEVITVGANDYAGPVVRGAGDFQSNLFNGYVFLSNSTASDIRRYDNSVPTVIQSGLTAFTANDDVKLSIEGTTLRAWINGVQEGVDQDATEGGSAITGGQPGIMGYQAGTTVEVDNWEADDISSGGGGTALNLPLLGVG